MRFFIDNNLPPALAQSLHALSEAFGHEVVHKQRKFDRGTPDVIWIGGLGEEGGWTVVTQDRVYRNPLEKEALRRSGLIAFCLRAAGNEQTYWIKSAQLTRWWPRIIEQAELVTGGAVFDVPWQVTGKGKFQQVKI